MIQYMQLSNKTEKKIVRILRRLRTTLLVLTILCLLVVFKGKRRIDHYREVAQDIPSNTSKFLFFEKKNGSLKSISQVRNFVNQYNQRGNIIINDEILGPISKDTVVFVITVRGLSIHLKFFIISLAQVQGIEKVLLVFSHMLYDEDAHNLIESIDFCRVMQIYYPYSMQMYPDEFPGYNPQDCPYDMDLETAQATNCVGSNTPDINGRFRNPKLAERKHHWWWTANMVFENVLGPVVEDYEGIVVFLKEDLYVLKDFLYMILFMKQVSDSLRNSEFLTLECASYNSCFKDVISLDIAIWDLKFEPHVLAFDVKVWNSIVSDYDIFCTVDDESWARSLLYLSMKRDEGARFRLMSVRFPRVYSTRSCELEQFLKKCEVTESVYQILDVQTKLNESLFPAHQEVYTHIEKEDDLFPIEYSDHGGWSDPRDRDMCKNLTKSKIKKIMRQMKEEFVETMIV